MKKILIIDDDRDIRMLLNRFLTKSGYDVSEAGSCKSAIDLAKKDKYDLIITDYKLPDGDGIQLSRKIGLHAEDAPIIMITAYSDVKIAVKAVKKGLYDYITKPLLPDELLDTISRALEENNKTASAESKRNASPQSKQPTQPEKFIQGHSAAAKAMMEQIALVAPTNLSVILDGETGTGKEYAAKEIHRLSRRSDKPFVALDCGALPNEIAGSELFGHVKGAFTGALEDKIGSFEYADGGTLFLDEIGNLEMQHQVKLLRVLQESKVKRLGSNKVKKIDVRVIAATNDDLVSMSTDGDFRQDLYFRLNEFTVDIPPLREREQDVLLFAEQFIGHANQSLDKSVKGLNKRSEKMVLSYPWPGNLRELKNVMKRAVLLCKGKRIKASDLPNEIRMPESYFLSRSVDNDPSDLKEASLSAEHEIILDALRKTGNNKTKAAELLNIDRKTLYNKLKQYQDKG